MSVLSDLDVPLLALTSTGTSESTVLKKLVDFSFKIGHILLLAINWLRIVTHYKAENQAPITKSERLFSDSSRNRSDFYGNLHKNQATFGLTCGFADNLEICESEKSPFAKFVIATKTPIVI